VLKLPFAQVHTSEGKKVILFVRVELGPMGIQIDPSLLSMHKPRSFLTSCEASKAAHWQRFNQDENRRNEKQRKNQKRNMTDSSLKKLL
jgi:hypothetical protein